MTKGSAKRKTKETDVQISLEIPGRAGTIATGIPFFDHMLTILSVHSGIGLEVRASGDTGVDFHHTVEDVGISLGKALGQALGKREGIRRFGFASVPLDEALCRASLDLSRPGLYVSGRPLEGRAGDFDAALLHSFFKALADNVPLTLHLEFVCGTDAHHMIETAFKATAHALREAVSAVPGIEGVLSSKGTL